MIKINGIRCINTCFGHIDEHKAALARDRFNTSFFTETGTMAQATALFFAAVLCIVL